MKTKEDYEKINKLARNKFAEMKISSDMVETVIKYLEELGALTTCNDNTGKCGSCSDGYTCTESTSASCLCVKN